MIWLRVERWATKRRSARLDRLAAARVISHLIGDLSARDEGVAKSRDVMMIEAWLWRVYGAEPIARSIERWVAYFDEHGEWPDLMGVHPRRVGSP